MPMRGDFTANHLSPQGRCIECAPRSVIPLEAEVTESNAIVRQSVMGSVAPFGSSFQLTSRGSRDATPVDGESKTIPANLPRLNGEAQLGGLPAWRANRALKYIEGNLGSKIAVREIADCLALSTSYFARAFKESLGSSPGAYIAARRVERAKLMMASTRVKLAEIALACGFTDQSHFTRSFRRAVGMTPGLWRRTSINRTT